MKRRSCVELSSVHGTHIESKGDVWCVVNVHLHQMNLPALPLNNTREHRGENLARAAPVGVKVNNDWSAALLLAMLVLHDDEDGRFRHTLVLFTT